MLISWQEFSKDKRKRKDIEKFSLYLMDNIIQLQNDLMKKTYQHGPYYSFKINDPKPRDIHKAKVRDRIVHHAVFRILYPYFDKKFMLDSYSCRLDKGTHKAINRFRIMGRKVSHNNTKTVWVLKCDIRKFFANINHRILKDILIKYIKDKDILWLLVQIIDSFQTKSDSKVGLPLGNITSQLLINIYMNEFDQFLKRELKINHFIRYCDDFVILNKNREYLVNLVPKISGYLENKLGLFLNQDKVFIKPLSSGIDFLGWVHFPHHCVLRTTTKRRMFRRLRSHPEKETIVSYLGLLKHGNSYKLIKELKLVSKVDIF